MSGCDGFGARAFLLAAVVLATGGATSRANLLVNGDFESGGLSGWFTATRIGTPSYNDPPTAPSGAFALQGTSGLTPLSVLPALLPAGGGSYALSDSTSPGSRVILQSFTLGTDALESVILSFDWYTYDWSGLAVPGDGLDYLPGPNQNIRVDIMRSALALFSVDPQDVVVNLVDRTSPNDASPAFRTATFDLTPYLLPGGTYTLRFGQVDNLGAPLNFGIDNVSLRATTVVPEPSSLVLLLSAAAGGLLVARRRGRPDRAPV
jgi:hypothetical protein